MKYTNPTRGKLPFNPDWLPRPGQYYKSHGIKPTGGSEWKKAHCPFHLDKHSLRVRLDSGGFRCRACRVHGGDIVDFHMKVYGMGFVEAVKVLGVMTETAKDGTRPLAGFMLAKGYRPEALHEFPDQNDCPASNRGNVP